ncbi:alpha-hydroxy-acid oxidizing protein [Cupriavidus basilensis]|uniref:Alpha-hydroxy-acid oxidizing protein n=1 Tax=Cupriavidus basilensis TaxID=68895 RepID=A0ABT6AZU2_9BURK|nr:alpha-hydroxy-acid oxidizing protein [Cupriavidus basilensis]MDF3837777.1 alpha-hydroxy-acid oxidizing protein [Cupriavidus basilensis]
MGIPLGVEDYRRLARRRLPRIVFDYIEGGADDESGLARNRHALDALLLDPARLTDVSVRKQAISLGGKPADAPLVIAPMGLNGACRPDGDVALARAAARAGIPFTLSTASNVALEDVARRAGGRLWFQLYVVHREHARALAADYEALVLTTDVTVNGRRERDLRNGFAVPFRLTPRIVLDASLHPAWTVRQLRHGLPTLPNVEAGPGGDASVQAALLQRRMDAGFCWDDFAALRDAWPRRLYVKGVLNARDAARCMALGADGVIASNHGGRQLADLPAPVDVLPGIRAAIGEATLMVDSGFRNGRDVVKALARGANAVMLGRAVLYGLAARGEAGVDDVLAMFKADIDRTLALIGCPDVALLGARLHG